MQTYALYCIYDGVEEGGNDDEDVYPVYKYTLCVSEYCTYMCPNLVCLYIVREQTCL